MTKKDYLKDYSGKNIIITGLDEATLSWFTDEFVKLVTRFGAEIGGGWTEYTEDEDKDVQGEFESK